VEKLAASVPDSGGVYFVHGLAGLGAPHRDPYARGTIVGLTGGSNAGQIARGAGVHRLPVGTPWLLHRKHRAAR
jgi:glycerol kinase